MYNKLLSKYLLLILLPLAMSLNGCVASGLIGKYPTIESDNFAIDHIARPSGYTGCGVNTQIQIDYTDFYGLACGVHISVRVPSGKTITISQTSSVSPDHIEIVPEKGETIYMVNDCIGFVGTCGLSEVEKGTFRRAAQKCGEEIKVGYNGDFGK
jgi:hypothetical protein